MLSPANIPAKQIRYNIENGRDAMLASRFVSFCAIGFVQLEKETQCLEGDASIASLHTQKTDCIALNAVRSKIRINPCSA